MLYRPYNGHRIETTIDCSAEQLIQGIKNGEIRYTPFVIEENGIEKPMWLFYEMENHTYPDGFVGSSRLDEYIVIGDEVVGNSAIWDGYTTNATGMSFYIMEMKKDTLKTFSIGDRNFVVKFQALLPKGGVSAKEQQRRDRVESKDKYNSDRYGIVKKDGGNY